MITIIDYDAGNVRSVANMLRALGAVSHISGDPADIAKAERLILPGVGHFDHGMKALEDRGLIPVLNKKVLEEHIPLLGICLGAQLLTRGSDEGKCAGLGWIDGRTVKFDLEKIGPGLKVPHMGWADTRADQPTGIFVDLPTDARFYYVHSYHIICDNPHQAALSAVHGYKFVAGVQRDNIVGVQFHPEKSHRFGMELLARFVAWQPAAVVASA